MTLFMILNNVEMTQHHNSELYELYEFEKDKWRYIQGIISEINVK